jgi:hypothetical protein
MSLLSDTLLAIKESSLSRGQLEQYEQMFTGLYSDYMMRVATLQKAESLYFGAMEQEHPELPDVKIKRMWRITDEGLELRQKETEVKVIAKNLSSIKSRIFQTPNY